MWIVTWSWACGVFADEHFVNLSNSVPISPYINWTTSATKNIQDAVDIRANRVTSVLKSSSLSGRERKYGDVGRRDFGAGQGDRKEAMPEAALPPSGEHWPAPKWPGPFGMGWHGGPRCVPAGGSRPLRVLAPQPCLAPSAVALPPTSPYLRSRPLRAIQVGPKSWDFKMATPRACND
jgi:hypothetical protein